MALAHLAPALFLGPLLLAGALACTLAAALAQLGRRSAAWDVLTHGAPIYLAAAVVSLAAALLLEPPFRTPTMALGAFAIVAAVLLIAPEYLRATGPSAPSEASGALKVIQFNAWNGRGGIERAVGWLAAEQPDILVVQETTHALREAIAQRTGMTLTGGPSRVAVFTRATPIDVYRPTAERDRPVMLSGATIPTPAGPAAVLGVHYPWPTEWDRLAQVAELVRIVRAAGSETTILAGDFNSTPWSFARRREDSDFGLVRRTRALFSWPAAPWIPFPLLPIDHVYAGAAWATVKVERGPYLGSDHYPVVVVLAPRAVA